MPTHLAGVFPAVVTPFGRNQQFLPDAFARLLACLYAAGVHGVYVGGNTGEGPLLSLDLREAAVEAAVRCSPAGKTVVVHVGAMRTADAIRLARHAARTGAHAVSSLPPLGIGSLEEIANYYRELAAASDLPVLLYYFPEVAPALRSYDDVAPLCRIPNIIGLKFTGFDLFTLMRLKADGHVVWNGRDEVFAAGLLMGADGGVGTFYNLVPAWFVAIWDAMRAGRIDEARALQSDVNRLIAIVLRYPMLPAIKALLKRQGIDCGVCASPRAELPAEREAALLKELAAARLDLPDFSRG